MTKDYPLLKLKNVSKFYYNKGMVASGFTKVSLEFNLGEFVAITGESGSGKSTLLNVLSGLDSYEDGEMYINGEETSHYGEDEFEKYRKNYIGNIFQSFNLVNSYTVYQNIELVLLLNGYKKKEIKNKVLDLIKEVDLYKYRNTRVSHLSGGQKQRVAIARALAKDTPIIIADEPTGNLDSKSAKSVLKLLANIAKERLVIVVTHNYEQIEEYATRKIEMHDGKVREDLDLKKYQKGNPIINDYQDIKIGSLLRIGIRNTFNIFVKFALMFIVFLFIVVAFFAEYSSFRKVEYEENLNGYNYLFSNSDQTRIIIKKQDGSEISEKNLNYLRELDNVQKVEENDVFLDNSYDFHDEEDHYFWTTVSTVDEIEKVDEGRLPENDNEVVIAGYTYNYYLAYDLENTLDSKYYLYTDYGQKLLNIGELKIVGVIYNDDHQEHLYVSQKVLDTLRVFTNEKYSKIKLKFDNNEVDVDYYSDYMKVIPSSKVSSGKAIISYDTNSMCKYSWCKNKNLKIKVTSNYYSEDIELVIDNYYTKASFDNLIGLGKYSDYNNAVFISFEDYNTLFNKHTYQSSVFANNTMNVEKLENTLNSLGYTTLALKNAMDNDMAGIYAAIRIFRLIVTIILFIVLFFISYFVIKLIQKSKNIYYSTVRILGGSAKVIRKLIRIELFTIYHLAFILVLAFALINKFNIIKINFISELLAFLTLKDFIIIYLILFILSYLLAARYARKLFKTSAMKAYSEEV